MCSNSSGLRFHTWGRCGRWGVNGVNVYLEIAGFVLAALASRSYFSKLSPGPYLATPGPSRLIVGGNRRLRTSGPLHDRAVRNAVLGMLFSAIAVLDGLALLRSAGVLR